MKISKIILFICSITVFVSGFLDVPYISNAIFRMIVLLYVAIYNKISSYWLEKKIQEYKTDIIVQGISVYIVPFKYLKVHNAMIFKGRKYNIIIEEETLSNLNEEQINAVLYHEVGHTHTVNKEIIVNIGLAALFFSATGLHDIIYKGSGGIYILIGVVLFLISEYMKRFIEYRADEYAIRCGIERKTLETAVRCIEEMNPSNKITISDHPKTERRFK